MSTLKKMSAALALGASLALPAAYADEIPNVKIGPGVRTPDPGRLALTGSLGCTPDRSTEFTDTLIISNLDDERLRRGTGIRWRVSYPGKPVFAQGETALPERLAPGETAALRILPDQVPALFKCTAWAVK